MKLVSTAWGVALEFSEANSFAPHFSLMLQRLLFKFGNEAILLSSNTSLSYSFFQLEIIANRISGTLGEEYIEKLWSKRPWIRAMKLKFDLTNSPFGFPWEYISLSSRVGPVNFLIVDAISDVLPL